MPSKTNYPQGVEVSNVKCSGPHSMKADTRHCPENNLLKQKIVSSGGDRCFRCFQHDNPHMNAGRGHNGTYTGGSGLIGSKGSPKKKGSGKTKSAGK